MRTNGFFALLLLAACSETPEPTALARAGTAPRSTMVTDYTVRQLPSLDRGESPAEVLDVDSHGHAVGVSASKAVMWLGSGVEEVVPGASGGIATGINDAHQIVGMYSMSDGIARAFVRNPAGQVVPLPDPYGVWARAEAINAGGQVVGTVNNASFQNRPALWMPGVGGYTLTVLDVPAEFQHAVALDINVAGMIVGTLVDASGMTDGRAAVWTTTGALTDVGTGVLYAVNALGEYVGYDMGAQDVGSRAFRGIGASRICLEGQRTVAYDINDHGLVGGNTIYALDPYEERAVIWQTTEAGILPPDLFGQRRPVAINNSGVMGGTIGPVAVLWEPTAPPTQDQDDDGVNDADDNCPAVANPSQVDLDDDGIGDACDTMSASDVLGALRGRVAGLDPRLAAPLLAKLDAASASLARGQENAAAGQIGAFVNQLNALVRRGDLSADAAAALRARAEAILIRL